MRRGIGAAGPQRKQILADQDGRIEPGGARSEVDDTERDHRSAPERRRKQIRNELPSAPRIRQPKWNLHGQKTGNRRRGVHVRSDGGREQRSGDEAPEPSMPVGQEPDRNARHGGGNRDKRREIPEQHPQKERVGHEEEVRAHRGGPAEVAIAR